MKDYQIIKELKGGSFSSTLVIKPDGHSARVRKFISNITEREYGLVRWQSQIRRMQHLHSILPEHTPPVLGLGVEEDFFYYDIPFYEQAQNLHEYLHTGGEAEAKTVFEGLLPLMSTYENISYGDVKGSFSVFFSEEVVGKLARASSDITNSMTGGYISAKECEFVLNRIETMQSSLEHLMQDLDSITLAESLTHGNLTLENALYDHSTDRIILIDPYSETYADSILGDISQLMQSSVSKYEQIVSLGEDNVKEFFTVESPDQRNGIDFFGSYIEKHVSFMDKQDRFLVNLFHAAQFIRMFPFKIGKTPRLAIYFLLHGLNLIEETKIDADS